MKSTICNLDTECLLKKHNTNKIIILKNHILRKKLSINLLIGQCLQDVHLMKKKNLIITEEKIVYIEKLCKKLKECTMKIINYEKKKGNDATKEENKLYEEQETCHISEKKFSMDKNDEDYINRKNIKDHCHYTGNFRGAARTKCNLNYKVSKDIPIIIHNTSYDTHFIINQLAEEFKGELKCIGENVEKLYHYFCTN